MKIRRKLSILAFAICFHTGMQAQITFELNESGISPSSSLAETYSLPLLMLFTQNFQDEIIRITREDDSEIYKGVFGNDIQISGISGNYEIEIDPDGNLLRVANPEDTVDENTIKILLEGKVFKICLNRGGTGSAVRTEALDTTKDTGKKEYVAGYLLYDAMFITKNIYNREQYGTIDAILSAYDINVFNYQQNPYLNTLEHIFSGGQTREDIVSSKLISSIGGLDITTIADGFARFLVSRTKRESNIAYFERFYEILDENPDLRILFPITHRTLRSIGNEIYMFEAYIQSLRESFEKDLSSLPSNFPGILDNHKDFFDHNPELDAQIRTSIYLAAGIQDKIHPGLIIEGYDAGLWNETNPNLEAAVRTLQLLSSSLMARTGEGKYWAPVSDIEKLYSDDELLKIYLGLLMQNAKRDSIFFLDDSDTVRLADIIGSSYSEITVNLPRYKDYLGNLGRRIQELSSRTAVLQNIQGDSLMFEKYYSVVSSTIDLLEYSLCIETMPHVPGNLNLRQSTRIYFDIARTYSDLAIDIHRRNYSSAIVNSVYLYDYLFSNNNIESFMSAQAAKNTIKPKDLKDTIASYDATGDHLMKFGSFMALVTQAETSAEIEAALESFALPTGSARIKRETDFNVSVNAYCGVFAGGEKIEGVEVEQWLNSYGFAAPIGIAINKGWVCKKRGWSTSLFLSVVDIGALTAFRFANDSIETVPTIELKSIVSPGVFFSLGIPRSPISLNVGWQAGPLLREVKMEENTYGENYSRVSFSLLVDIPIVNIYTRPRR